MPPVPVAIVWKRVTRRFKTPLRTATGAYAARESLVVRVELDDGRQGYAEAAPWPGFATTSLDVLEQELRRIRREPATAAGDNSPGLLRSAIEWAQSDHRDLHPSLPCAGLLREDEDLPALNAAGYLTLKRKIGTLPLREEQRAIAALVRAAGPSIAWRLDANGILSGRDCAAWCDFLSEFEEIEWLEQPMRVGAENEMLEIAERAGVSERVALDESATDPRSVPQDWPGVIIAKPALTGDSDVWRSARKRFAAIAYGSVFETPFGRQAALLLAAEDACSASRALGFGTLGAFDDALDIHPTGPVSSTVTTDWAALWERI